MAYRTPVRTSRWKAMIAAILVTFVVGAGVVSGLEVDVVQGAVERLQAVDIILPRPPPPKPPPKPPQEKQQPGQPPPAAPRASPDPKREVKLPTAEAAPAPANPGTGNSAASGQGGAGSGGAGNGGGSGDGNIPARLVRNLSGSDYRRLSAGRLESGSAGLSIQVGADGRVDSCRVEHSSGDRVIDSSLCPLIRSRLRFDPARNAQGRPIPFYTHYLATWRR